MANYPKIRISKTTIKELEEIGLKNSLGTKPQIIDFLIKKYKRCEVLENTVKIVHLKTKL